MTEVLSTEEYNQLQAHNNGLQTQNRELQTELLITQKALELSIIDFTVETDGFEPTDEQIKSEVTDYKQQAQETLESKTQCP